MQGGRATLQLIIVAGSAALVALAGGAGLLVAGAVVADGYQHAANVVMEGVDRSDEGRIASLVHAPYLGTNALSSSGGKEVAVRNQIHADETETRAARALVAADVPKLRRASATLAAQAGTWLVLPERSSLGAERKRLDSLTTAFGVADEALAIADDQFQLVMAAMDADEGYAAIKTKLSVKQVSAGAANAALKNALQTFPDIDAAVQKEQTLAAGPNVPPALRSRASVDAAFAADFKHYLQAGVVLDLKTVNALQPRIDTEANVLDSFDSDSVQAYENQLFQGYEDRFDAALQASGLSRSPSHTAS